MVEELGERVVEALLEENTGNTYHRINTIRDRWMEGLIRRADYYI